MAGFDAAVASDDQRPGPGRAGRPRRQPPLLASLLLIGFCVAFGVRASSTISRPFVNIPQDYFWPADTNNAAGWSTGARALRELGPIESKFGGYWGSGDAYAHHPPLIYSATAAAQLAVPDDAQAAVLLVFVGSLATVFLFFALLRELGVAPTTAALSVVVGLSVPMFLDYGTMLDTLMFAMPLAVGYLVVWQRARKRHSHPVLLFAVAALLTLAAWEGVILIAFTLVASITRHDARRKNTIVGAGAGIALGVIVTAAWSAWVGGIDQLLDQGLTRAGHGSELTLASYLDAQGTHLRDYFGIVGMVLLVVGSVAMFLRPDFRPIAFVSLGSVVVYALVFTEGSFVHEYWNYWVIIPLVLGTGAIASAIDTRRATIVLATLVAASVVIIGFGERSPLADARAEVDRDVGAQAVMKNEAPHQAWVPFADDTYRPGTSAWWKMPTVRYYIDAPLRFEPAARVADYVRAHPRNWVIVNYTALRGTEALAALGVTP